MNFEVGDYVLVSLPVNKNKLKTTFRGPYRIIEFVTPFVVRVEHLVAELRDQVHVTRVS